MAKEKSESKEKKFRPRKGLVRKFMTAEFGMVDLDNITPAMVEKLVKAGYLVRS